MKLIWIIVLAGVLLIEASEQVELNCPKGWIIIGQVIYVDADTSSKKATMCLICQLKTNDSPFGLIELCILEPAEFQRGKTYRRQQNICDHESEKLFETKINISDVCSKRHSSPTCGANISADIIDENVQFLSCDKETLSSIQKNNVEIKCPKNWKLSGIKRQEKTYYKSNEQPIKNFQMCATCNLMELKEKKQISICTTREIWHLKTIFYVQTSSENDTNINHTEKPNNFCGYRLTQNKTYRYNKKQLIQCDEFDRLESSDLKDSVKNSSSAVSMFQSKFKFLY
jgi:hypothetical protein